MSIRDVIAAAGMGILVSSVCAAQNAGETAPNKDAPPALTEDPITKIVAPSQYLSEQPALRGPIRVAPVQGDRAGILSFVFDDGLRDQFDMAIPWLNEQGIKGTFVLCPQSIPKTKAEAKPDARSGVAPVSWEEWRAAAREGHEIGNHGWSHMGGSGWTTAEVAWREVVQARLAIEQETSQPVVAFVYPFNKAPATNNPLYAAYIRTHAVWSGGGRLWYGGDKWTPAKANEKADEIVASNSWAVTMIHGIKTGYSPFTNPEDFREHLKYVKSRDSSLWAAPLGVAARYLMEAKACRLDASAGPNRVSFTLVCPLKPDIFNVPLTVVVDVPAGTAKATAHRADRKIETRIKGSTVLIDVVPGDVPVNVEWE